MFSGVYGRAVNAVSIFSDGYRDQKDPDLRLGLKCSWRNVLSLSWL
jgi:hypothetical protein